MAAFSSHQWDQISSEHCYSKIMSNWSATDQSLPTYHIFEPREREDDDCQSEEEEEEIDIVGVADTPFLPYNHQKAKSIMNECSQHMNLVRLPLENSEVELERIYCECNYQQQTLLTKCLKVFREDLLARLVYAKSPEEPVQRRLHSNQASKKIRKIFGDIKWDPILTQWCHRTLIRVLDDDLLPIYMDILQVLKSKCPALVEQMIHSGPGGEGINEALKLLLKRPWNPSIGMTNIDKQLHFDPAPLFITIPHTSSVLGSRRWRLWQSQFNTIGKVFPVVLQEHKPEASGGNLLTFRESIEDIIHSTLLRVQELKEQFPSRPIVLISWSNGCRVACKVAEVEKVSCLVNLSLPVTGITHTWKLTSDPFVQCTTPSIFIVGEERGEREEDCHISEKYVEELRAVMKTYTSLVVLHGGDELLRLSSQDKYKELITQSMIDRLIQDKIYEFFIYVLPSTLSTDVKIPRKRKLGSTDEPSNSYLTSATPNSPIILTTHTQDDTARLTSLTTSNSMIRSLLSVKSNNTGKVTSGGAGQLATPPKVPRIGRPPKLGRPRSKSVTYSISETKTSTASNKSKIVSRNRSKSGEVLPSSPPVTDTNNESNSNNASPDTLLSLTKRQLCPLAPITPPRTAVHSATPPTSSSLQTSCTSNNKN